MKIDKIKISVLAYRLRKSVFKNCLNRPCAGTKTYTIEEWEKLTSGPLFPWDKDNKAKKINKIKKIDKIQNNIDRR